MDSSCTSESVIYLNGYNDKYDDTTDANLQVA